MDETTVPTADLPDDFEEQTVLATLATLPPNFAARLDNIEIVVAEVPTLRQRHAVGLGPGQDLYGLYEGIPLPARGSGYNLVQPDLITIFRAALRRDFPDPAALAQQVRRTTLHELAHYFGISDARLHELGAY